MKLKYGYIFIPILIILVVFYIYDMKNRKDDGQPGLTPGTGIDMAGAAVIEIRHPDETIRLIKNDDGYLIETPFVSPADREMVDELLSAVANIKVERNLGAFDEQAKVEYGLDAPVYSLDVLADDGSVLLSFVLGGENPGGTGRYATTGSGGLFLLESKEVEFTEIGLDKLRSRAIVNLDESAVTAVECSTNEVDFAFEFDGNAWFMSRPKVFKVTEGWCEGLLMLVGRAMAEEFVPEPNLDELEPLMGGIRFIERDSGEHLITFMGINKSKGVLAKSSYQPEPFLTEFRIEAYLNQAIDDLRETRLMLFAKDQVESVIFREVGGENLRFERDKDDFRITKPEDRLVNEQEDFDKFFDAVLGVSPVEYVDSYDSLEMLGLDPYWIKIEITTSDGGGTDLYIGKETDERYYANIDKSDLVFILSSDGVDAIMKATNKLRFGFARI